MVTVDRASKIYRSRSGNVTALAPTDLEIESGSLTAIVGPSGCGKSTLLKMIAGLIPATSGAVEVDGTDVDRPSPRIGMMFQQPVLLPWRNIIDNVLLPVDVLKRDRRLYADRASELLDAVGLQGFEGHRPDELSGGMRQRVAMCRALIADPAVLLLDEPFGALDSITRERLNDLLASLCAQTGKTAILVTHDVDEAVYLGDSVVVMSARPGRVVAKVPISLARPRTYEVRGTSEFATYSLQIRQQLVLADAMG